MDYGNRPNEDSSYDLFDLVKDENLQEIQRLISLENHSIDIQNENGTTLLMEASENGHFEIVKYLVSEGADVRLFDIEGTIPLIYAARNGYWDIFDYLFNLTDRESKERSAFISAIDGELEILKALVERQVNVDTYRETGVESIKGFTALITVVQDADFFEIVETLLNAGADPNLPEEDTGGTPLMYAAKRGCLDITRLLLKAGADPTIRDRSGEIALMKAGKFGHHKIVKLLDRNM